MFLLMDRKRTRTTPNLGTQLMESLLLNQYQNSENLKEYYGAFISEMDYLFSQIEEVYFGRFLTYAVGEQLDKVGKLLNQERAVPLQEVYFGFENANGGLVGGFGDGTPYSGSSFLTEERDGFVVTPLGDGQYRRLLTAIGSITNQDTSNLNMLYSCVEIIIAKVPSYMKITEVSPQQVLLELESASVSSTELALISYFIEKYILPTGTSITFSLVSKLNKTYFNGADNWLKRDVGYDVVGVGAEEGEASWLSWKTKSLLVDENRRYVVGNTDGSADSVSYAIEGDNLNVQVGWGFNPNSVFSWDIPLVLLSSDGVDFNDILNWKIFFGNNIAGVEINGKEYVREATENEPDSLVINTIGYSGIDPTGVVSGFLWGIRHTGSNRSDYVKDLTFLDLDVGSGNTVPSSGVSDHTWTIQNTADWRSIL